MPLSLLTLLVSVVLLVWTSPATAGLLFATWTEPTQNTDGSALTNLQRYRLYYGPTAASVTPCTVAPSFQDVTAVQAAPPANSITGADITGVTTGTTYFVSMTAVSTAGTESACSTIMSGVARANGTNVLVTLVTGSGTVTGEGSYPTGTTVTPVPHPDPGFAFAGWVGAGCSGTGACNIILSTNQFVRATFAAGGGVPQPPSGLGFGGSDQLLLTTSVSGPGSVTGSGILCQAGNIPDCSQHYPPSTVVALTATPSSGAIFTRWDGACTGTGACNVTMTIAQTVMATFTATGAPPDPGVPQIGTPTIGPTTTTYPITWATSDTPVYQYNGGYNDAPTSGSVTTNALSLVVQNRTAADCQATQGDPTGCNAYICVQAQDALGTLSLNSSCNGFFVPVVPGTTLTAASCQQADVAAKIALASDGDTIAIPAGQCTIANGTAWTGSLTITKRLHIQGAGIDQTVIQDNRDQAATDFPTFEPTQILIWSVPSTGLSEMSGITWQGYGGSRSGQFTPTKGMIVFNGDGTNTLFRLHDMKFLPRGTNNAAAGFVVANLFGVVDHIICDLLVGQSPCHYAYHDRYLNAGLYGDNSWAQPSTMGTAQELYFENNQYLAQPSSSFQFATDAFQGARVVYRHNTVLNTVIANHGLDSGGRTDRSQRHMEVYDNTFRVQAGGNLGGATFTSFRGGTGLVYNNAMTVDSGGSASGLVDMSVFRTHVDVQGGKDYSNMGRCGQETVTLTSSGTTATATAAHTITFPSGFQSYVRISGATPSTYDGTWIISAAPSTTVIQFTTSGSNLGSGNGFVSSPWDQNSDAAGYACIDQAGRGQGDNWNGDFDPAHSDRTQAVWPNQALEPMYFWGNTVDTGSGPVNSPVVNAASSVVVLNRDYYNCTVGVTSTGCDGTSAYPKPGYTPLVYPHPLVTVVPLPATIPQTAWTLRFVDSENVGYTAVQSFDGDAGTFWHTQFSPTSPPPPHEIQIDLGATYAMTGFRYLPRQDGNANGRIGQYEFYVSADGTTWGTAVATGTFANDANEKRVTFASSIGRYVRLRALTEASGNAWTSMAELRVEGTLASIQGLTWDFAGAQVHIPSTLPGAPATGSDLWPFTVASNGTLYTAYGDGGGANGANDTCRTNFGIHAVTGTAPNYTYANTWGCTSGTAGCANDNNPTPTHNANCNASFGGPLALNNGVPVGLIAVGNALYTVLGNVLVSSSDGAHTWATTGITFTTNPGDFIPSDFVQFQPGNSGIPTALDGYLYITGGASGDTTRVYLARAPVGTISTYGTWQWYNGSTWGTYASKQPIFTDAAMTGDGVNTGGTMQYFPVLQRYIFIPRTGSMKQMRVLASANPWGPWTTVYSSDTWGGYDTTLSLPPHIIPTSISADNLTFWMSYSGFGSPTNWDNLSLIKGTFTVVP